MATEVKNTPVTPARPVTTAIADTDNGRSIENIQLGYEQHKKTINTVVTIVLLAVVGICAYIFLYKNPREEKAAGRVYRAQQYFMMDSTALCLNGDGQSWGVLKVMKEYSGTKTANLCHYYAGVCYLKNGDAQKAIKQLEDFNGAGTVMEHRAKGLLGDAYMETGNARKAIDNFKSATEDKEDILNTPEFLLNLGMAYEANKQPEDAKAAYKRIHDEYPQSAQARDIDRYLGKLGVTE